MNMLCKFAKSRAAELLLLTIISIMAFEHLPFNSCIHGLKVPRLAHLQMRCRY